MIESNEVLVHNPSSRLGFRYLCMSFLVLTLMVVPMACVWAGTLETYPLAFERKLTISTCDTQMGNDLEIVVPDPLPESENYPTNIQGFDKWLREYFQTEARSHYKNVTVVQLPSNRPVARVEILNGSGCFNTETVLVTFDVTLQFVDANGKRYPQEKANGQKKGLVGEWFGGSKYRFKKAKDAEGAPLMTEAAELCLWAFRDHLVSFRKQTEETQLTEGNVTNVTGPVTGKVPLVEPPKRPPVPPPPQISIEIVIYEPAIEGDRGIGTAPVVAEEDKQGVKIRGRATSSQPIDCVEVNGNRATLGSEGKFDYLAQAREGENRYIVEVKDKGGNREEKAFTVTVAKAPSKKPEAAPLTPEQASRVTMWVLTVGISEYAEPKMSLRFADNDAIMLADTLKERCGGLFGEVRVKCLVNKDVTRESIMEAMTTHLGQAAPDDVVFVFIAGHGVKHAQTGSYYFLTYDCTAENFSLRGLRMSDLDEQLKMLMQNVRKVIIVLDTCHAGAMQLASMRDLSGGEDLAQVLHEAEGIYTLAASKAGESSLEHADYRMNKKDPGHGAFTYALLQGLTGEANKGNNAYLSLNDLFAYVARQVPRMTKGKQHPYSTVRGTDIPLALANQ